MKNQIILALVFSSCVSNESSMSDSLGAPISSEYFAIDRQIDRLFHVINSDSLDPHISIEKDLFPILRVISLIDSAGKDLIMYGGGISPENGAIINSEDNKIARIYFENSNYLNRIKSLQIELQQNSEYKNELDRLYQQISLKHLNKLNDIIYRALSNDEKVAHIYLYIVILKFEYLLEILEAQNVANLNSARLEGL